MSHRFILVFPLADNDVLDALAVAVLLLVDGVLFVELLALLLGDVVQRVLVDNAHPVVLQSETRCETRPPDTCHRCLKMTATQIK